MASVSWQNNADGLWSVGANWSTGGVPGAADQVTINTSSAHTITFASGSGTISTLYTGGLSTLDITGGALNVTGSSTLYGAVSQSAGTFALGPSAYLGNTTTQKAGTLKISSGVLRLDGTGNSFAGTITGAGVNFESGSDLLAAGLVFSAKQFQVSGATVTFGEKLAFAGAFSISSGTLALGGETLALTGPVALDGGATSGTGTISVAGSTTANSFYLTGSTALVNTGTITGSNYLYIGYYGTDTAHLQNQAGATFKLIADADLYGQVNASITNAGTFSKASGNGLSSVNVDIASTGVIRVASGTLAFSGASDSFGGSITGAGNIAFDAGADMLSTGVSLTAGSVVLGGATVTEGGNMTYAGNWSQTTGSLALGGHTLTQSGAVVLDGGYVLGSGTMTLKGTTEFAGSYLSGSVDLINAGVATQTATFYDGYLGTDTSKITNSAGATYSIAGNYVLYGATGASFVNSGALIKSGGSGAAVINVNFTGAAGSTMAIAQGTLRFSGATNTFAAPVSGSGTLELNSGADKISTSSLTMGGFLVDGATVTLGVAFTYSAGLYTQTSGTLALAGHNLILTSAALDGGIVSGAGALLVSKAINLGGTAFEGSVVLENTSGVLSVSGNTYIGYNASDTAELSNKAGATVSLIDNASLYSNGAGAIVNAGTIAKSTGGGYSLIQGGLTNTGTLSSNAGTLRLTGASDSLGGVLGGAGTLELEGGSDSLSATSVTVGRLLLDGANLTLARATTYAGLFHQTAGTLALGGLTLTLNGAASFEGGEASGAGTIAASGATTAYSLAMEGSTVFSNTGTVTDTNVVYVGYNSSDTAQFDNAATGVFRLTTGGYVSTGGASLFNNAGTLIKTGTGISYLEAPLTSTGTLQVSNGTLRLSGSANSIGGTVSGAGTLELAGGAVTLSPAALSVGGLLLDGATVTLGANLSLATAYSQTTGSLALGGHTLTLTGTTSLDGGNTSGSGKIAVSGTTEVYNYYLEGSTQLANSGSLTVATNTSLNVGYNSSDTATLSNLAGGHIELMGGAELGNGGSGVFSNAGSLIADGSGLKYISPTIVNSGRIEVSQGSLTCLGTVTGAGTFAVDSGTHLSFNAATSGGLVSMAADSSLGVSTTAGFADKVGGFSSGDLIDLNGFGFNTTTPPTLSFNVSTDKLVVTEGTSSFVLTFSGTYTAADFVAVDDQGIVGIAHS